MASPHSTYPHQGPGPSSYYPQSPIYASHSPGPVNPYQYPPQSPYQMHQPQQPHQSPHQSPRLNGRGGPAYPPLRGAHAYHNFPHSYPQHQHQHQPPYPMPSKRPHPYPPSYANAATYIPPWQSQSQQPLSPLPKQLSMPPPVVHFEPPPQSPAMTQAAPSGSSQPAPHYENGMPFPPPPTASTLSAENNKTLDESTTSAPAPPAASPQEQHPMQASAGTISVPFGMWAIWSRRPHDPSHAPGIIISPRAHPPQDVMQRALAQRTPPPSPPPQASKTIAPVSEPEHEELVSAHPAVPAPPEEKDKEPHVSPQVSTAPASTISSSSVTETTGTPTTLPGSPASSSNTSLSASLSQSVTVSKLPDNKQEDPDEIAEKEVTLALPDGQANTEERSSSPTPTLPASVVTEQPAPPPQPAPLKKSWASLLQPASSSSASTSAATPRAKNALPVSSVVGFSIPASSLAATAKPAQGPHVQIAQAKRNEILALLNSAAAGSSDIKIRPRGLVNSGNMCFANSVLQVLVYCSPFHRLFRDLGRAIDGVNLNPGAGKTAKEGEESLTLVNAIVEFLKEFTGGSGAKGWGKGKGKEKDLEVDGEEKDDEWAGELLPSYVYDAMKEQKRFDSMRSGQQEDAEEFLGFFLDALEEELMSIVNVLTAPPSSKSTLPRTNAVTESLAQEPSEEGWHEVGKKNRTIVTRTIKSVDSPISRIFGGKFRSTLKVPHQKDSVVVEDWRALRLDIQPDHIHNVQDALSHISHPQPVQVISPLRPGVTVEASQQVLIDALPPVLVLHMKRFCYDTGVGGVVKVAKQVKYGPELEVGPDVMSPTNKRTTRYKLFGVLYHHGHSASGGHYTLDVLHPNRFSTLDNTSREGWIRIDDELLSDIRPDDVFGTSEDEMKCAYLLFYRRIR